MSAPESPPPSGPGPTTPPSEPPSTPPTDVTPTTPPSDPPSTPPTDVTPATPSQPPASESGSGDGTQGESGSGSAGAAPGDRQAAQDEFTSATSGPGSSATTPSSRGSKSDTDFTGGGGGNDTWLGQDTFVVSETSGGGGEPTAPATRARFGGFYLLGTASHATRIEAEARQSHQIAQISSIGSGPPGPGNQLPGQNPFFNLLSGPGGPAAGLMLAGMLAVLGAAFLLPRDRLRAFRVPTVTWSPLAYVPPIELPG